MQQLVQTHVMIPEAVDSGSKVYGHVYDMCVCGCVSY